MIARVFSYINIVSTAQTDCAGTATYQEVVGGISCVNEGGVAFGVVTPASGCQIFLYSSRTFV